MVRTLRRWWHRLRGWWLLTAAAAASATFAAIGRVYPGVALAVAVAIGGMIASVVSERGRARLAAARASAGAYIERVDRLDDPLKLRVHRAAMLDGSQVPPFVARDRLPDVCAALDRGGFVLIVGDSTAGKSRLAYEAMRATLPQHVCVRPTRPDMVRATLEAARRNRPSVLWLEDFDVFLGDLTGVDVTDLGSVVVLATMRTHERARLSHRHDASRDPTGRQRADAARDVLDAVTTEIRVGRRWSSAEVAAAARMDDPRIAGAVAVADRHGIAECLAAGPQLVADLRDAWDTVAHHRGAALVTAAVDLRRAGYHRPVPLPVLQDLHESYLVERQRAEAWEEALRWAAEPLHITTSLLEPVGENGYVAFDYLVDTAVRDPDAAPVPSQVWAAILEYADLPDLVAVAWEAVYAGNLDFVRRAADRAMTGAEFVLSATLVDGLGDAGFDAEAVERMTAIVSAAEGRISSAELTRLRRLLAWRVGDRIAGRGDPVRARELAERVVRDSVVEFGADHEDTLQARIDLARQTGAAGDPHEARRQADAVHADATAHFGADHRVTLTARYEVAVWTRSTDGPAAGVLGFSALIEQARALGTAHESLVVDARWNLGGAVLETGDAEHAAEILATTVRDGIRIYGPNYGTVLEMRLSHISAVDAAGRFDEAVELAEQLCSDCERVLGPNNPTTGEARELARGLLARRG
jgi:tetratricopeptide repeat protein